MNSLLINKEKVYQSFDLIKQLNKVNLFKLNNPPNFYVEDEPEVIWNDDTYKNEYIQRLNVILEFKLPIILYTYNGIENLYLKYLFEMDPKYKNTKRCYFYISHYYIETLKDNNLKWIEDKYESQLEKCKKQSWERMGELPNLESFKNHDEEIRLRLMIDVLKKNNPNFLYFEQDTILIETCDAWWGKVNN
jgi:hypothetical protein